MLSIDTTARARPSSPRACLLGLLALALSAPACGNSGGSTGGADATPTVGAAPADGGVTPSSYTTPFPPALPQALAGSAVIMASPSVVPVFFSQDPLQPDLESFLQGFFATPTWQIVKQYGVVGGAITPSAVLSPPTAATLSDAEVQAFLSAQVKSGALPAPAAATIYLFYFPENITLTLDGQTSCIDLGGYHNTATLADGATVTYAVVPRCPGLPLGELTFATSHELAEAATDPLLTAYNQLGAPYGLWMADLQGGEIGDLCQNLYDAVHLEPGVGQVSRLWSNAAAWAQQNPCQPAAASEAFFAVPILTELVPVQINGVGQNVESVPVDAGQIATVEVRLFSPGQPGLSWTVAAQEFPLPDASGNPVAPVLALSFQEGNGRAQAAGQDGATLHLQIAAQAKAPTSLTTVRLTSTAPGTGGTATQTEWVATVRVTGASPAPAAQDASSAALYLVRKIHYQKLAAATKGAATADLTGRSDVGDR